MADALNFLLENGVSLDEIERLKKQDLSLEEIAGAVRQRLERGESITEADKSEHKRRILDLETFEQYLLENGISVRYNVITKEAEIQGVNSIFNPETLAADLHIILHDQLKKEFRCTKELVADLLGVIAGKYRFNPVIDMLRDVKWDYTDRIEPLFDILHLSAEDNLSRTLVSKWLFQCWAMAQNELKDGYGADGLLVLQGPQGIGKTSFVRKLGVRPELVKLGQYIDTHDKDTTRRCTSAWIVELGELETTLRSDLERLKAFITAERDEYRLPYGRADQIQARRTSLIATCNTERFLIDPTGSRRFWTVPVEKIDLDRLAEFDSLQLWAEVKELAADKPNYFRLTREEQAQLARRNLEHEKPLKGQLEVEDIINTARAEPGSFEWRDGTVSEFKTYNDTLRGYSVQQISQALDKLGLTTQKKRVSGHVQRVRNLPFRKYGKLSVVGC